MTPDKFYEQDFEFAQNLVGNLVEYDFGYNPYPKRILLVMACLKEDSYFSNAELSRIFVFRVFDITRNTHCSGITMRLTIKEVEELLDKKELSYFRLLS